MSTEKFATSTKYATNNEQRTIKIKRTCFPIQIIDRGDVYLHKPPPLPEFNNWSIFGVLFSIFGSFFDHGSDIATAYVLWAEPDSIWWFSLTVVLIVVPTVTVNAFSLYWYQL
jgi:hypothetical protein